MTAGLVLISFAGLALTTPAAVSEAATQQTRSADIRMQDLLVSSIREGRVLATGRTDARGHFRLSLPEPPTNAHELCLNGPSVRAALDRGGDGDEPRRADMLVELMIVVAINERPPGPEQQLLIPLSRIRAGQSRSADMDLCYRPFVNVADGSPSENEPIAARQRDPGSLTPRPVTGGAAPVRMSEPVYVRNADGTISILEMRQAVPPPGGAEPGGPVRQEGGTVTGRVTNASGAPETALANAGDVPPPADYDGDGRPTRRTDPRIPPPGSPTGPEGLRAPRPTVITGTIRVLH